ncbi:hypothetical protein EV426DRAFT_709982 [Tirmania nivea]|nr:hypothetical protein EV426DRAFT_709982 [Tirmania nivea]
MNTPTITMCTEIITIAGKLVKQSQGLRERYREELEKLDGPNKWELALEIAWLTQEKAEIISFAAQVQKEVIESWTDEDYTDMKVDRVTANAKLGFYTTILPLADIYTESERRKERAKERLEATWGDNWEDLIGGLMPPWPAEEFLWELAVFSENLSLSSSSSVYVITQENADLDGAVEGLPNFDAVVDEHRSISYESSPPSIEPQTESAQDSIPSSDENVKGSKSQKVASGKAKEVEVVTPRKCNKRADQRISKRKKFGVEIPIINLDMEAGVEELKREALGVEEQEDALAVEEAMKVLFWGQGRPGKELATRMLEKMMKVMRAEVVEIEDN